MEADPVVVIGGGPAGLQAARSITSLGNPVLVVEERNFLGGTPIAERYASITPAFQDAETLIGRLASEVEQHPLAKIALSSTVSGLGEVEGGFRLLLAGPEGTSEVLAGAIVVATGFQHFDPGRETQIYGYYEYPDVLALQDLESMLKDGAVLRPSNGQPPRRLCFIQCVGSRDRHIGNEYCSKVCCGVASKEAIEVREHLPDCQVFIFYIDMRMYGYWENQIYWPAQERHHVQYVKGMVTEVLAKGDRLLVRGEDTTMGRPMELEMDMVILSVGMEPSSGTRRMAKMLSVAQNKYGFIESAAPPLDTVSTSRSGVFACGAALGPADLEDCTSTAGLAAVRAVAHSRSAQAGAVPA